VNYDIYGFWGMVAAASVARLVYALRCERRRQTLPVVLTGPVTVDVREDQDTTRPQTTQKRDG